MMSLRQLLQSYGISQRQAARDAWADRVAWDAWDAWDAIVIRHANKLLELLASAPVVKS